MPYTNVGSLVRNMTTSAGASASEDLVYFWIETALSKMLSLQWSWNEATERIFIDAAIEETSTFTWTAGNKYIVASAGLSDITWEHTGRSVKIGRHWYRVLDVGFSSPTRIYLDGPLLTTETGGQTLTFYRNTFAVKSNKILQVEHSQNGRLKRFNQKKRIDRLNSSLEFSSGEPCYFQDDINFNIPTPKRPPVLDGTATSLSPRLQQGRYFYYYVHYDPETGQESAPGPTLEYDADGANNPVIKYGSLADTADTGSSFPLRLYRSDVDPRRSHCPMHRMVDRGPSAPGTPFEDNGQSPLYNNERYWNGMWVNFEIFPPDKGGNDFISVIMIENFGYTPKATDSIDLGQGSALYELLIKYIQSRLAVQRKDTAGGTSAEIAFDKKLAFLYQKHSELSAEETDIEAHPEYYPGKGLEESMFGGSINSVLGRLHWDGD